MKRILTLTICISTSMFIVIGCSTKLVVEKPQCSEINWVEKGRQDGMQGQPSNNWMLHSKACKNMAQNYIDRFVDGWNRGLSSFCTEEHGFILAKTGQEYRKTCPDRLEEAFLRGYRRGLQAFVIEQETTQIIAQLDGMEKKLRNQETSDFDKTRIRQLIVELKERKQSNLKALETYNLPL